ncbi:MAG TPA: carbohydrate binding domain-containing protein [Anaerolineales bacterium]|nr:carbohydrate binding domain-containing protein [Anaerolineales bacterium]
MKLRYFHQPFILFLSIFTIVSMVLISLATTAVAAPPIGPDKLADFEGDVPGGWFVYNGGASSVSTAVLTVGAADPLARPAQVGDNGVLEAGYSIGDFGGFGQDLAATGGPQDWSSLDGFSFWFYGSNSTLTYQLDIMDNRSDPSSDTAERFSYWLDDDFTGWRHISVPWGAFVRRPDWQPGGAPDDGLTLTEMWGWAFVLPGGSGSIYLDDVGLVNHVIDDFESGVAPGTSCAGIPLGFCTFQGAGSSVSISAAMTPPAPLLPELGEPNTVIQVDLDVTSYAGFIHGFTNEAGDTWVPQDWSAYEGFAFWLYGNDSGTSMFIDLLENRNPGSTTDDAERWTVTIPDDFSAWRYFEFPFSDFVRKDVGNGAPNDGLTLDEVHGWAFGTVGTGGPRTFYLDQASLFGLAAERPLEVTFAANKFDSPEGTAAVVAVKLTRPLKEDDPDQVSVSYTTEPGSAIPERDYTPASGTLTFVKGDVSEQTFTVPTFDNPKHDGDKTVILRLFDPVDIPLGFTFQARINILDDDPFDSLLIDDFERFPHLWEASDNVILSNPEIAAGDPMALPGQWTYEGVLEATVPLKVDIAVEGRICNNGSGLIPVVLLTTDDFDATSVDHTTVTLGAAYETHVDKKTGEPRRHEEDADGDGDMDLVFHFRYDETGLPCDPEIVPFNGWTFDGQPITAGGANASFGRDFALDRDWSLSEGLRFWFYGQNTGDTISVELLDNRAHGPGPAGWSMVWSDEFDDPAGTPPNPAHWTHEIGDGTANNNPGWGNSELEYYTDSTENAATDGAGNLVITAREADGSLMCYYGPCEYTSARLISWYKAEFAYGRIEARIQVPQGAGLWPAFWSLGTDIGEVDWPQTGEIDIMEFVGRQPNEIFGTIHGPGYSGGASFGGVYSFGFPVYDDYHTFTIEWQPNEIQWYVDGILYHQADPADVAPNEWVFNHPFFIILNVAVGGNFGGPVGPDTVFPQTMKVDYVRVYQGPDTSERFEASFTDDFDGWQEVLIPFESFARSAEQPDGAPDDGLGLTEVWGYGFKLPDAGTTNGTLWLDQVRLTAPVAVTVVNTNDSGSGSLRQAIDQVADGGTISFDAGLADGTITLTSGPLWVSGKTVNIDGSGAPGLTVSGGGADRVLIVDPGATASVTNLTMSNGYGFQLAGCVLNNGTLTLDHVTVTGCLMTTNAGDFWQGGGGIYNGDGATFNLIDSSVVGNTAGWSGGGVYSFFNTTTTILRSTISGNISNDVGGGIRSLGNAEIVNSTISGNTATGWYGGALFVTDGVVNLTNVTVAENISPVWAPADVFVGTFTDASATLTLANSIVSSAQDNCFFAPWGSGAVTLMADHNNVLTDATCFAGASDLVVADAGLDSLADNGGPTLTQALLAGSPAIDAADAAVCPATDQRGVARPQGAGCDVGAFEYQP